MRTSVITGFAKNARTLSGRRRIAVLAATTVLAGGVQILAADTGWACDGPYKANNPVVSQEAQQRHHNGTALSDFVQAVPLTLNIGSRVEIGVEFVNPTGADFDAAAPSLTLKDAGGKQLLHLKDVTVEVLRDNGSWTKLGIDDGCGGEAIRVDTSPLMQHLKDGGTGHATFRVSLAAGAPKALSSLTVSTGAYAEVGGYGKEYSMTVKVAHPDAKPAEAAKPAAPAKPAPAKPAAEKAPAAPDTAPAAAPAAEEKAAPATTAPAGTPELAQTGSSETNTFLALSAAALLALGAGVLIAVRRFRPQR